MEEGRLVFWSAVGMNGVGKARNDAGTRPHGFLAKVGCAGGFLVWNEAGLEWVLQDVRRMLCRADAPGGVLKFRWDGGRTAGMLAHEFRPTAWPQTPEQRRKQAAPEGDARALTRVGSSRSRPSADIGGKHSRRAPARSRLLPPPHRTARARTRRGQQESHRHLQGARSRAPRTINK